MPDKPVINLADVELSHAENGENFEAQLGSMASRMGAEKLGCRLTIVPPGKRAWPFHSHHAKLQHTASYLEIEMCSCPNAHIQKVFLHHGAVELILPVAGHKIPPGFLQSEYLKQLSTDS